VSLLDALILGAIQGITEFLPISSDGHLAIAEMLLGQAKGSGGTEGLFYELLLHVATMLAIAAAFRRELWSLASAFRPGEPGRVARRVAALIAVASVPTAVVGFALKDLAEAAYAVPVLVGAGLVGTSVLLASTLRLRARERPTTGPADAASTSWLADLETVRVRDALLIGAAQGTAVWPGLSRSGTTIVTALWLRVPPVTAARFSLLISLPAVGGGFLLELHEVSRLPPVLPCVVGFLAALVLGWFAIGWLIAAVRGSLLGWFAAYTAVVGVVVALFGSLLG
jgi:undecaprenyl-diphosphatase